MEIMLAQMTLLAIIGVLLLASLILVTMALSLLRRYDISRAERRHSYTYRWQKPRMPQGTRDVPPLTREPDELLEQTAPAFVERIVSYAVNIRITPPDAQPNYLRSLSSKQAIERIINHLRNSA